MPRIDFKRASEMWSRQEGRRPLRDGASLEMTRPLYGPMVRRQTYAESGQEKEGWWHRRHRKESERLLEGWGCVLPTDVGLDGNHVLADMLAFGEDGFAVFLEVLDGPDLSKLRRLVDLAWALAPCGAALILVCNPYRRTRRCRPASRSEGRRT